MKIVIVAEVKDDIKVIDEHHLELGVLPSMMKVLSIKPMPTRMEATKPSKFYDISNLMIYGWNACINAITGETE